MAPSHLPLPEARGIFSSEIHCENQVKLLKVKPPKVWGPPYVQFPLEFSTLRIVHTEPLAIHQLQFQFSYPSTVPWRFLFMSFALISCDSLYLPVCFSNFGGGSLLWNLTSLKDLRRVVGFSISSAFYS